MVKTFRFFWEMQFWMNDVVPSRRFFSSNDGNRIRGIIPKWPNTSVIFTVDLKFSQIRIPDSWLIGGLEHDFYFPFHIWDVILPIDEVHHFSRWLLHHQPVGIYILGFAEYFFQIHGPVHGLVPA